MIILNSLIEGVLQLIIFSVIPFVYYLIRKRKVTGFRKYLGLVKPPNGWFRRTVIIFLIGIVLSIAPLLYLKFSGLVDSNLLATNNFKSDTFGVNLLFEILIYGVIRTSLSEELLFRGFLGKRLIGKFGFVVGNSIQAILFGMVHGLVFIQFGIIAGLIIFIFPTILGYLLGWVNEQKSEGSIVPSWFIHGASNIVAPIIIMLWL